MALTKASFSMIDGAHANVIDYGAVPDGATDSSAAFQAAINSGKNVYVPAGSYVASFTLNNTGQSLLGDGSFVTQILPPNNTSCLVCDDTYITIKGIGFMCYQSFTGKLLNFDGSSNSPRRIVLDDVAAEQDVSSVDSSAAHVAEAMISFKDQNYFTGYNTLHRVRTRGGKHGIYIGPQFSSVISIRDSIFSRAGIWGMYLDGLSHCTFETLDVANNGSLGTGDDTSATHGGIYMTNCENIVINSLYCEYNKTRYTGAVQRNNLYITDTCSGISINGLRDDTIGASATHRTTLTPQVMGENNSISYFSGKFLAASSNPKADGKNIIINSKFEQRNSSNSPFSFSISGSPTFGYDTSDTPKGFDGSLTITPTGVSHIQVPFYNSGSSKNIITNIANYAGQVITFSGWIKLYDYDPSLSDYGYIKFGITNQTTFGGNTQSIAYPGIEDKWIKVTQQYTIVGTETYLAAGISFQDASVLAKAKVAAMSCAIGSAYPSFDNDVRIASVTYNPPSLTVGSSDSVNTVTVTNVDVSDFVTGSFNRNPQGIEFVCYVSADDTISYYAHNPSGNPNGTVDLASDLLHFRIEKINDQ